MVFGIINYHWLSLHDKEQLGPESGFPLRSHLKTYSADIISVCLPPPWLLWFSLSLFLTRPCLSHPDIPVFVLYCLTLSFEAAFTSVRSRGFYTQLFLKGDELLCLVLRSPSPLFGAPLIFQYHLSVFYFHDTLSPVRMPWSIRRRPCATMFQLAFLRWPSIANTLLQCFPYGRRGERVGFPRARFIGPILMSLGVADWFDTADIVLQAWGEVFCGRMKLYSAPLQKKNLPSCRPWGCQGRPARS